MRRHRLPVSASGQAETPAASQCLRAGGDTGCQSVPPGMQRHRLPVSASGHAETSAEVPLVWCFCCLEVCPPAAAGKPCNGQPVAVGVVVCADLTSPLEPHYGFAPIGLTYV